MTNWIVCPTAEEDHNWCDWMIIGHDDATKLERPDYNTPSSVEVACRDWRLKLKETVEFDHLEEVENGFQDLADHLRSLGYEVMFPASLGWIPALYQWAGIEKIWER